MKETTNNAVKNILNIFKISLASGAHFVLRKRF